MDGMSLEVLIAAQHKRLTKNAARAKRLAKKRERRYAPDSGWLNNWRDDCRTYADLYVPPAPKEIEIDWSPLQNIQPSPIVKVELSHTEWADGYRKWQSKRDVSAWTSAVIAQIKAYHDEVMLKPCFAENEI
jgi:hypothetical protein